jgi:O-antigen ligase
MLHPPGLTPADASRKLASRPDEKPGDRQSDARHEWGLAFAKGGEVQRSIIGKRVNFPQFWVLCVFLGIVFLTGGSSRSNVAGLLLLRPLSFFVLAYGVSMLRGYHWRQYRLLCLFCVAVLAVPVLHLVPLPAALWSSLPGRGLLREIDALSYHPGGWRPLSLVPDATRAALYSLAVPLATGALAIQLNDHYRRRLLWVVLSLIGVSALVGLLQATGLHFYPAGSSSDPAGLFANRNHQGAVLALFLPMLAVAIYAHRADQAPRPGKSLLLAGVLVGAMVIVLIVVAGSRTALVLALLSSLLIPFIVSSTAHPDDQAASRASHMRRTLFATGMIGLMIGGLGLAAVYMSRDAAIGRMQQIAHDPRYVVWDAVTDALPHFLPWGSGVGSYVEVYQTFEPDSTLRPTYSNHAHNEFLEIALTTGIPGIMLAACALAMMVFATRAAIRARGPESLFPRLGVVLMFLLAFASMTDYPARTPIIASILALAAVWAASSRKCLDGIVDQDD